MGHGEELHYREMARRKALWALASLLPTTPRVLDEINVLDGIELRERHETTKQSGSSRHEGDSGYESISQQRSPAEVAFRVGWQSLGSPCRDCS